MLPKIAIKAVRNKSFKHHPSISKTDILNRLRVGPAVAAAGIRLVRGEMVSAASIRYFVAFV